MYVCMSQKIKVDDLIIIYSCEESSSIVNTFNVNNHHSVLEMRYALDQCILLQKCFQIPT